VSDSGMAIEVADTDEANGLIARAVDAKVPVETMEKLLAMRRELKAEKAREQYIMALAAFQAECPPIPKDKAVTINGVVRYRFAPMEGIVKVVGPLLFKHGFSYSLDTAEEPGHVVGICRSYHKGGHEQTTRFRVPIDPEAKMNEAQKAASAQTYATRYAFRNAFGILTADEDDDGASAGPGAAGTHETPKDRPPMKTCPKCGKQSIIKGKKEYSGGWICWKQKGGCGAKFSDDAPEITAQGVAEPAGEPEGGF